MYYVYDYDNFYTKMEDEYDFSDERINELWNKIVESKHGRLVDDGDYIFSEEENVTIEDITIKASTTLYNWIKDASFNDVIEVYDGWGVMREEVVDYLLKRFDTKSINEPSNADLIYNAENPREKLYVLLNIALSDILEDELEKIREAKNELVEELRNDPSLIWE